MRGTMVALVLLLLAAFAAGPAFAGGEGGQVELGIYGGRVWFDDYGIFNPENKFFPGARIGYWFSHRWNMEVSAQRVKTETEFEILGLENTDITAEALRLNLLYNMGTGGFRPFLTAGLGKEKFAPEGFGESCDIGWNVGAGFRAFLSPKVALRADGRYVRVKVGDEVDDSQGNVEAMLGLSLFLGGHGGEVEEVHTEAAPNQPPAVTCAADRAQILPGESANITVTATDPEGGPLTYEWSSSSGHVAGNGAVAALDFAGVNPPSTATVTVRVTDDHGNSATSDCTVALMEAQRRAEAVSCVSGGFPRNLSRLTNVDKACLDDVAQRLSADPRARVVIIGHADSHEKGADIAQRRADAVRDYLVNERSIEASRVTTRSAGTTKMVATGSDAASMAQNRRVEVWFVPEGTSGPE
jgi:outer membrane protein OmpA-like peptidoglycan-associated protein/opacity protein-like surface antigen